MAGGPLMPISAIPVTAARVFPNVHVGAGANSKHTEGLGVEASLGANAIWRLRWLLPDPLPTGTGTLRLYVLANATSGVARVNPAWVCVAVGAAPDTATLVAESVTPDAQAGQAGGSGATLTWGAGDADQLLSVSWTMNASTLTAGQFVVADITFESTSWTLAQVSTWIPVLLWI